MEEVRSNTHLKGCCGGQHWLPNCSHSLISYFSETLQAIARMYQGKQIPSLAPRENSDRRMLNYYGNLILSRPLLHDLFGNQA